MPEFIPIAGVLGLLMRFLLEIWIVPKGAVSIKQTKGQYWSYGLLTAAIVMIAVITFTMDMYAQGYFSLFLISFMAVFGAAEAWLEWHFAREAREYIVTGITFSYLTVSLLILEFLF